jgi:uncharacterized protein (UPF0261 family)
MASVLLLGTQDTKGAADAFLRDRVRDAGCDVVLVDAPLIGELCAGLRPGIELVEMDTDINDPAFATAMAERLDAFHRAWAAGR